MSAEKVDSDIESNEQNAVEVDVHCNGHTNGGIFAPHLDGPIPPSPSSEGKNKIQQTSCDECTDPVVISLANFSSLRSAMLQAHHLALLNNGPTPSPISSLSSLDNRLAPSVSSSLVHTLQPQQQQLKQPKDNVLNVSPSSSTRQVTFNVDEQQAATSTLMRHHAPHHLTQHYKHIKGTPLRAEPSFSSDDSSTVTDVPSVSTEALPLACNSSTLTRQQAVLMPMGNHLHQLASFSSSSSSYDLPPHATIDDESQLRQYHAVPIKRVLDVAVANEEHVAGVASSDTRVQLTFPEEDDFYSRKNNASASASNPSAKSPSLTKTATTTKRREQKMELMTMTMATPISPQSSTADLFARLSRNRVLSPTSSVHHSKQLQTGQQCYLAGQTTSRYPELSDIDEEPRDVSCGESTYASLPRSKKSEKAYSSLVNNHVERNSQQAASNSPVVENYYEEESTLVRSLSLGKRRVTNSLSSVKSPPQAHSSLAPRTRITVFSQFSPHQSSEIIETKSSNSEPLRGSTSNYRTVQYPQKTKLQQYSF